MLEPLVERRPTTLGKGESFRSTNHRRPNLLPPGQACLFPRVYFVLGSRRRNVTGRGWQQFLNGGHGLIPHLAIRVREMRSNVGQNATISEPAKRDDRGEIP